MSKKIELLKSINSKAQKLLDSHARLLKENKSQQETILKHLATIDMLQKELKQDKSHQNASDIALLQEEKLKNMRKEIDSYITTIDKVIARINE
jgi:hypothetical protein